MAEIVGLTVNSKTKQLQLIGALGVGKLQEKTVEANEKEQVISPDYGYYGLKSVTVGAVEVLPNAKYSKFSGDETGGKYVIEDETITPLINQVQRIAESEDSMTFDEATEALLNVVPGGGLPDAESGTFGNDDASSQLGFSINEGRGVEAKNLGYSNYVATTWKISEALSIMGVRVFMAYARSNRSIYLWNASGELIGQIDGISVQKNGYTDCYFSNPINIGIGEEFTFSLTNETYSTRIPKSSISMNSKVTFVQSNVDNSNPPTGGADTSYVYGVFCPIIGTASTVELPDEYQIARSTLDDIANEVKRITGTTGKITIDTILTTLEGITAESEATE